MYGKFVSRSVVAVFLLVQLGLPTAARASEPAHELDSARSHSSMHDSAIRSVVYDAFETIMAIANACLWLGHDDKSSENQSQRPIQPADDAPQPKTPKQSASLIRVPDGFRIELVASEPLVQDPTCVAFDERGRMFVCELHGYNVEGHLDVKELNKTGKLDKTVRRVRWEFQGGKIAEQAAKLQYGVVKMLSDSDGDGRMDKAVVWADDLPPCYGIVPAQGGIVVTCAPDIVYLADHDGDGRPDVRQKLLSGFRTQTIERGINNPRWGLDNSIYVGAGGSGGLVTGPSLAEAVQLPHTDFRIRFDQGLAIEPATGRVGTFGMTINDVGDRFPATGGRPAMYALPLPYRYLNRNPYVATPDTNYSAATYNRGYRISAPHPWRVKRQQDPDWVKFYGETETNSNYFSGGCSNEFYGADLFPEQYRGNIFYCEPSLNIVHRCVVTRDGAGYQGVRAKGEQESEFLASTDQWFRPMNLRVGPDGALYIVDMYREIIEDYSAIPRFLQQQYGLNKGGDYGRIWRLVPNSVQSRPHEDLTRLSNVDLASITADANPWRRLTAQRLLIQRNANDVAEILSSRIRAAGPYQGCIHALYTLSGLGQLQVPDIEHALTHKHYGVRLHALRLSEDISSDKLHDSVLGMVDDEDPSVRLQVAMTLGESRHPKVIEPLVNLARRYGNERWMAAAITSSSILYGDELLRRLLDKPDTIGEGVALLQPLTATISGQRNASAISQTLSAIPKLPPTLQVNCLRGMADGLSRGSEQLPTSPDGWAALNHLLESDSVAVREAATKLAAQLPIADRGRLTKLFEAASQKALDRTLDAAARRQAIQILTSAPYAFLEPVATKLLDIQQPAEVRLAAVEALGHSPDKRVGSTLMSVWSSYTPTVRKAVMNSMLSRSDRLPSLIQALDDGVIEANEVDEVARERLTTNEDSTIVARAKKHFRDSTDGELQSRMQTYLAALKDARNVHRGDQVYKEHCMKCHKVGAAGHEVGPDLNSIVNRPDESILMELLDPSGRIDPEYQSYIVITTDGRTFSGILASESATSITLRREKGESTSILRRDIEKLRASNASLMPSNLHEQVSPSDAADLISYLRMSLRNN